MRIVSMVLIFICIETLAFADATTKEYRDTNITNATLTVGSFIFKLSRNVYLSYKTDTTSTGYSIGAYHKKGNKTFASSSSEPKIYGAALTAKEIPVSPVGTASADFSLGWSIL